MRLSRKVLQSPAATVVRTLSEKQSISMGSSNSHMSSSDLWQQHHGPTLGFATEMDFKRVDFATKQTKSIRSCHRQSLLSTERDVPCCHGHWRDKTALQWTVAHQIVSWCHLASMVVQKLRNTYGWYLPGDLHFPKLINLLISIACYDVFFSESPPQLALTVFFQFAPTRSIGLK